MECSFFKQFIFCIFCSVILVYAQDCSEYENCEECNESADCVWGYCQLEPTTEVPNPTPATGVVQSCYLMSNISEECTGDEMLQPVIDCSLAVEDDLNATDTASTGPTAVTGSTAGNTQSTAVPSGQPTQSEDQTTLPGEQTTLSETTVPSDNPDVTDNTTEYIPSSGASFDAASFIGGIVLCGGLILIVFLGCKFYESRSKNYHTL
ncbi:sialomucin core protein 24-like [Ptychodera flava]|uniref:sialomucin core protein 24-like n=1 Tax=Ptychodera flava TaxID=63121 RepID=UPI003969D296